MRRGSVMSPTAPHPLPPPPPHKRPDVVRPAVRRRLARARLGLQRCELDGVGRGEGLDARLQGALRAGGRKSGAALSSLWGSFTRRLLTCSARRASSSRRPAACAACSGRRGQRRRKRRRKEKGTGVIDVGPQLRHPPSHRVITAGRQLGQAAFQRYNSSLVRCASRLKGLPTGSHRDNSLGWERPVVVAGADWEGVDGAGDTLNVGQLQSTPPPTAFNVDKAVVNE